MPYSMSVCGEGKARDIFANRGLIVLLIKLPKCWPIPFCFLFEQSDETFYMMGGRHDAFILVMA